LAANNRTTRCPTGPVPPSTTAETGAAAEALAAREHRPMHERHDMSGRHAAMPQQYLGTGIDGHDRIERARLRITIELDQHPLRHRTSRS
jgi:hypothetical protein